MLPGVGRIGRGSTPNKGVGASGPVTDPGVTAINAEGWSVTFTSPPTFDPVGSPQIVALSRQGYDATGTAKTYTESLIITKRVRQAYPNQASLDASRCSLSDYVYSTDTAGVTNNSAETSPKPVANWARTDSRIVGTSFPKELLEVVAFHRNARSGKEVPAVKWTISDGSTSVEVTASTPVISAHPGDLHPVIVYRPSADVDISSLSNGQLTVNAKVYPWIGASGSIRDSADSAVPREFSPRAFTKNPTKLASPPLAVVSSGGNDGTGVVSTTYATTAATPFLTIGGALQAFKTQSGVTGGVSDGCMVLIGSGTFDLPNLSAANIAQTAAEVVITRDPNVARASAIVRCGSSAARLQHSRVRFYDVSLVRGSAANNITGETNCKYVFEQVDYDQGGFAVAMISTGGVYVMGMTVTNPAATVFNAGTSNENRLLRGLNYGTIGTARTIEMWFVIGSTIKSPTHNKGTRTDTGLIFAFSDIQGGSGAMFGIAGTEDVSGFAFAQCVLEFTSATGNPIMGVSNDGKTGNVTHPILHHVTIPGFFNNGRSNLFYDEGATARTCKLQSMVGNIHASINTKGDVFRGTVEAGGDASTRVGNWGYLYGVGCRGEVSQFIDANSGGLGTSFAQAYPGLKAKIGTSATVRQDPLFTNYQATTSGPTGGAGGGTYSITTGSPCENQVVDPVLNYDFAGNARPAANDAAGAYKAA